MASLSNQNLLLNTNVYCIVQKHKHNAYAFLG